MIKIYKGDAPAVLRDNWEGWTRELLDIISRGEEPSKYLLSRYNSKGVKEALISETFGKCAYCESPFVHVTYGDVEHIVPKSVEPSRRFDWGNLTVACDVCNTKKSDRSGLVDPYECDPEELFVFYGALMWAVPQSVAAQVTEEVLDLNRPGLLERRRERIEYIRRLVESAVAKPEGAMAAVLERARREVKGDKPFSACARAMLPKIIEINGI